MHGGVDIPDGGMAIGLGTHHKNFEILEARVGFEPTDGGFADLSLRPLGYRAGIEKYSEIAGHLSGVAKDDLPEGSEMTRSLAVIPRGRRRNRFNATPWERRALRG